MQADLLRGKSIGFLPTKVHTPAQSERDKPGWSNVELVIDEWILLEYACCFLPCQQNAVVEAVSKSLPVPDEFLQVLGIDPATIKAIGVASAPRAEPELPTIAFTPLEEIELALHRTLARLDLVALVQQITECQLDRLRGRV